MEIKSLRHIQYFLFIWIKGPDIFLKKFYIVNRLLLLFRFPYSFQSVKKIRQAACLLLPAPASLSTEIFKVISVLCLFILHFNRDRKIAIE